MESFLSLAASATNHIHTWDVSTMVKEAGIPSDVVDVSPPKMKGARQIPWFFDGALREANFCAFIYTNPMRRLLLHYISAPSVPIPQSGAAPSHMRRPSPPPITIPTFQLGPKFIWYTLQTGPIGHPVARGRGPLHSGQA
ncbi:hypothetical protein CY34DRAFT_218781 [Suillus luteus UH-Slu-Lm8-n1]|uniref:Uncharacterized protein n=1 Tax=Suillus luteus UH-Slu-Lm8-n1 TaxID=930992 RepID=A0A0D0ATB3_9AGAM|nr:hypothetical protein CY34DRAFT_218781 [Suillus luteus UH-Slu-Lm8-n1]